MSADLNETNQQIAVEADRLSEDVLWSEKQHFAMATVWRRMHLFLGIPSAIMAALAGVSALQDRPFLAAALAVASAVVTSLLTFLEPDRAAERHHKAGVGYSALRGQLRRFRLIDLSPGGLPNNARQKLEEFATEKTSLMQTAPHIGGISYALARKSISKEEHRNAVDTLT
jgi:hypothetical protein